jgi:hypothetical protein
MVFPCKEDLGKRSCWQTAPHCVKVPITTFQALSTASASSIEIQGNSRFHFDCGKKYIRMGIGNNKKKKKTVEVK